ncbi:c-Myc-binding protein homolog [Sipha flava]|uniref:c-Myc-binding protein homolog n=1 Tax=Sipha flava TaxID=143950 RepID=A0A8B8F1T2_9HEMI|nr:c-Myc-binding protein homolog [Sipha flava]
MESKPKSCIHSLDNLAEEFEEYLEHTGVVESLTTVLKLLYEMPEKPADPLEFMRTNMTEIVSEREELEELQNENDTVMLQIIELQEEIINMKKKIEELQPIESIAVPQIDTDLKDNNIVSDK